MGLEFGKLKCSLDRGVDGETVSEQNQLVKRTIQTAIAQLSKSSHYLVSVAIDTVYESMQKKTDVDVIRNLEL